MGREGQLPGPFLEGGGQQVTSPSKEPLLQLACPALVTVELQEVNEKIRACGGGGIRFPAEKGWF